jgi:MHS family proline/betaine transporter-like MFS transporter
MKHSMKKVIASCMIGNALEWYDFALYGFFVALIGRHFFPSHDVTASIIASYGAFAVAFILRPVGALVLGYIGDKMGRKKALILSLYLMALPTALIGVLPTYAVIGIMAPILLTALRFFQGFSMGGEFTGSMIYIAEHAHPKQHAFMSSFAPCSLFIGIIIGSGMATLVTVLLSTEALESWGWRVPFLISVFGAGLGIYMRRHLVETDTFEKMQKAIEHVEQVPFKRLLLSHWRAILLTLLIDCGVGVSGFFMITFMATYMIQFHEVPAHIALMINTVNMFLAAILIVFFGWLSDKIKPQWIMLTGCVGFVLFSYPLFQAFELGLISTALAGAALVLFFAAVFGPLPVLLISLFPPNVRYTGMSFAHNLAMALFGGMAPMIATILIEKTHDLAVPGIYLAAAMFVSMIGIAMTCIRRVCKYMT